MAAKGCAQCGTLNEPQARFCKSCGTDMQSLQLTPPQGLEPKSVAYVYHTELVSLTEKWLGKTHSGSSSQDITDRFNYLASQGWELVTMSAVPVVGKVFRSNEERTVTVVVWRREV